MQFSFIECIIVHVHIKLGTITLKSYFCQVCHKITEEEYSNEFLSGQKPQPKAFKQV